MTRTWQRGLALGVLLVLLQACAPAGRLPEPAGEPPKGPSEGPPPATVPAGDGKPVAFAGDRLVADTYLEFVRMIRPGKWEVGGEGVGSWAVDLERHEVAPWNVASLWYYYARPYPLKDGREVGLKGNGQQQNVDVTILLQDLAHERQEEVGSIRGGVVQIAPAGDTIMAYSRMNPDSQRWVGELWQYDWAAQKHTKVADAGWPVGVLSNGLAVAHAGEAYGPLFTWNPAAPGEGVKPLSPDGVTPFRAAVSPDGGRVCYFGAAPERSSWLELLAPRTAYASPNRVSPAPNPAVSKVVEYDVATGKSTVVDLPLTGQAFAPWFDRQGNCMVELLGGLLARVEPGGKLTVLYRSSESFRFLGWEGGRPVVAVGGSAEKPARVTAESKAEAWPEPYAWGGSVVLDWSGGEVRALDLTTGQWYQVTGNLAYTKAVRPAVLDTAGRLLVVQVESQPQAVYQVMKVEPVH